MKKDISRRDFLKGSLAATGLTVIATMTPGGIKLVNASGKKSLDLQPSAFFQITPDNVVKIMVPNSEMGQGVKTALPMIIADELEADWDQLEIIQAPAAKVFGNPILGGNQITVASASCRGFYAPMRKAGAAGRAMLLEAAAKEWDVDKSGCKADKGKIVNLKSGKSLTYGQLAAKAAKLKVPQDPPLKKESEFIYMGKSMPRVDIPEKVSGKAVFGFDVDLPDMHYAVLARPPAYGAKHQSFDADAAMGVKGVIKVVPTPRGIAVVAENVDAAMKGRDALKVKWGQGSHLQMDTASVEKSFIDDLNKPGNSVVTMGDVKAGLGQAKKSHEATYYIPCVAHATMEPQVCTAHVTKDRCDIYIPTQCQTLSHMVGAKVSGLPPEKVHIHTTLLGCGLGRRPRPDQLIESVIASKASGKPVKVVYTREEDIQTDFFRSAMAHRIKGGLDSRDKLIAWDHKVSSSSLLRMNAGKEPKGGIDWYCLWGLWDGEKSPIKARMTYRFPNFALNLVLSDLPIPVSPWRSVQNAVNAFATESFMDEMAHLAGKDPISFRMESLKEDKRAARVLEDLALNSNWGKPLPKGWGRGMAQHKSFGTRIAQVAEVEVKKDGTVKVHRIDVSVDCGPVINPDPLKAQIEGAVTMGVSTVLYEEVEFADGGVESANFDDYHIARMSDTPEINVHIIESNESIGGIGEPGVMPLAPAVANAVYNATGARVRRMPLTPERVLEAMKKA